MLMTFGILFLVLVFDSESATITQTLTFTYGDICPDNYELKAILINGQHPGPTIEATQQDELQIRVVNQLDHPITVHWMGLFQRGTVRSDGVPFVTQYPIPVKGSYVYNMSLQTQVGTYFYQAHTGLDNIWAYGILIIQPTPQNLQNLFRLDVYRYDEERSFALSQGYHSTLSTLLDGLTKKPFRLLPEPDSILINGRSHGNWKQTDYKTSRCDGYDVITVTRGKTYRFRVLALGIDSMLSFQIEGHAMSIIEADGILTDPVTVSASVPLQVTPSQRYSVLVTMDQKVGNYLIRSQMIPGPGPRNGVAILHYEGAPDPAKLRKTVYSGRTSVRPITSTVESQIRQSTLFVQPSIPPVPINVDRRIVIRPELRDVYGVTRIFINGENFQLPSVPFVDQVDKGVKIVDEPRVFEVVRGQNVEIVFQHALGRSCRHHPWNIHGHNFYIVGRGSGAYNPSTAARIINENIRKGGLELRDVVTMYPETTGNDGGYGYATSPSCGWTAIRFTANNTGVWFANCQFTAHTVMGMSFVIHER